MDTIMFHSFWTLASLLVFIGIVLWAFSGKRKKSFDQAARLPLEDDEDTKSSRSGEQHK